MEKWFNNNLERSNVRKHTLRHLKGDSFVDNFGKSVNKFYRKFSVTNWLIIMNIVVFLFIVLVKVFGVLSEEQVLNIFALQASAFFSGSVWTLLTSMFTHIWLPHLFFNIISLFFIGNFLEKIIGRKKFFWFYLGSGLFAGLFYVTLSYFFGGFCIAEFFGGCLGSRIFIDPSILAVGASGAIFGIAGLLAILTPKMKVYLIAGPIFAIIIQSVLSSIFDSGAVMSLVNLLIMVYIFFSIFAMFSFNSNMRRLAIPLGMSFWILPIVAIVPLVVIGLFVDLPIGNTAHFGGLLAGLGYGYYLKKKYKRKTAMIQKYFEA